MARLIQGTRRRAGLPGAARRGLSVAGLGLFVAVLPGCATTPPPPTVGTVLVGGGAVQDAGGEVRVVRAGSSAPARPGLGLETGDEVHTGPNGRAVLLLEGGRVEVIVLEDTEVRLGSIFTKIGKVVVRVLERVQDKFEVESEYAVAGAEGTAFLIAIGPEEEYRCAVLEGLVQLHSPTDKWAPVALSAGEEAVGRPGTPISTRELEPGELDDLARQVEEVGRASDG